MVVDRRRHAELLNWKFQEKGIAVLFTQLWLTRI